MVDLHKILNIYLVHKYIADIKQIESYATLAICLSRGRTLGGHKITAGQLQNPAVVEQLVRNEQAYKFLKMSEDHLLIGKINYMMYLQCYEC